MSAILESFPNFSIIIFIILFSFLFLYLVHQAGTLFLLIGAYACSPAPPPLDFSKKSFEKKKGKFSVLVLGASGGIGRALMKALAKCDQVEKIRVLLRKPINFQELLKDNKCNYGKIEQKIVNFDKISEQPELFEGCDISFYALGVYAGFVTEEEYLKVEKENAVKLAKMMREGGVQEIHWVTAIGTSEKSPFLFGRVKAHVEATVSGLGFDRVAFYRPGGVLTSDNSGLFGRERIILNRYLDWFRLLTVDGDVMAQVMLQNSLRKAEGGQKVEIFKNRHMNQFAKKYLNQ